MIANKKVLSSLLILAIMSIVFVYFYSSSNDSSLSESNEVKESENLGFMSDGSNALSNSYEGKSNNQISETDRQSYKIGDKQIKVSDIGEKLYQSIVSDNVVDGVTLAAIMTSPVYREIVKELPNYTNKESDTVEYENRISDYINKSDVNPLLSDYDVACNNDVCFGYFASESKGELEDFFNEFIRGASSPTHKSGYVNSMEVYNSDTGIFEYRVSFNSNPEVKSIILPR